MAPHPVGAYTPTQVFTIDIPALGTSETLPKFPAHPIPPDHMNYRFFADSSQTPDISRTIGRTPPKRRAWSAFLDVERRLGV
jgi:hypothetical protein